VFRNCVPTFAPRALRPGPVVLLALAALATPAAAAVPQGALPASFADVVDKLVPTVVNISTTQAAPQKKDGDGSEAPAPGSPFDEFFRDFFGDRGGRNGGQQPRAQSLGSGFIIDPSGLIVTNNHVVADAAEITVTLTDDTSLKAKVVGRDPVTDLALLKIDPKKKLPAVVWGDSGKTRVGDWVLAIGNPFGLGGSVTTGIVSARARDIHAGPYDDFIQTDAPINKGNSGGPMFNLAGEVIGINTAIYSPSGGSIGIGFAIPSALARPVIEQLKTTGKVERGWIGVHIQPMTDELAKAVGLDKVKGALVADVDPNSPAAKAKVQPGDVILAFNGKAVEHTRELPRMVAAVPPDKAVKMALWRDGKELSVDIKVGLLNSNQVLASAPSEPHETTAPPTIDTLGLSLAKITPELRREMDLAENAKGVVVMDLDENSAAASRGIEPGDIVAAVGHDQVSTPEQIRDKVEAAKKAGRKMLLLRIERDGKAQYVALPPG
jgi:serine protease Do